ncbi:DUF1573 domain-containing protein [Candidatus Parcubacteria bacterium]|nr:MAG: DUF1573 domain-containing protein [Candidatus Parcubacteria bacterium]
MKTKTIILAVLLIFLGTAGLIWGGFKKTDKNEKEGAILGDKIYVAVEEAGEIAVIDKESNELIKNISLNNEVDGMMMGYMPHNIQVAPDNKSVWVTANVMAMPQTSFLGIPVAKADAGHGDGGGHMTGIKDELIVIDPITDKIIRRIEVGEDMHLSHVDISPDSSFAIAASQTKGVLFKVNVKTYEIEKQVATGQDSQPHGLRVSVDGKRAYIATMKGALGVLDMESFTFTNVPLKGAAVQTAVTKDGKYALASIYDAKSLAVYEIASKKLSYVDLPKEAKGPVQIYASPDSKYVYLADQGYYFEQPISDKIYRISLETMTVDQTIQGGQAPHGVVVSKDGRYAYVTNLLDENISVIETKTGKEIKKIKVGKMPNGISVFYADTAEAVEGSSGNFVADHYIYDFGMVPMMNGKVKHSFTLQNQGSGQVKINRIYTSCMCTEAMMTIGGSKKGPYGMPGHGGMNWTNQTVNPGERVTIEVEVDPAAHGPQGTGPAKKAVYIETDSSDQPMMLLMDINVIR